MNNQVVLKGNLTKAPYFDFIGNTDRPFMRLYLAVDRPKGVGGADFFRVVAYDDRALFDYPYLQPGSEVLVTGRLRARKRKVGNSTEWVVEVVAQDITFLRKINWEAGDAERERIERQRTAPAVLPGRNGRAWAQAGAA